MMIKKMRRIVPVLIMAATVRPGLGNHLLSVIQPALHAKPVPDPGRRVRPDLGLLAGHRSGFLGPFAHRQGRIFGFQGSVGTELLRRRPGPRLSGAVRQEERLILRGRRGGPVLSTDLRALQLTRRQSARRFQDLPRALVDHEAPVARGVRRLPGCPVRLPEPNGVPLDRQVFRDPDDGEGRRGVGLQVFPPSFPVPGTCGGGALARADERGRVGRSGTSRARAVREPAAGWGGQHYQGGSGFIPRYSSRGRRRRDRTRLGVLRSRPRASATSSG